VVRKTGGCQKKTRWGVKKTRSGGQTKAVQNNTKNKVRGLKKKHAVKRTRVGKINRVVGKKKNKVRWSKKAAENNTQNKVRGLKKQEVKKNKGMVK
jgi:hypothetical protein